MDRFDHRVMRLENAPGPPLPTDEDGRVIPDAKPTQGPPKSRALQDLLCPYCMLRTVSVEPPEHDERPGFECTACFATWSPFGSATEPPQAKMW